MADQSLPAAEYVLIDSKGLNDYYEGQHQALYRNGSLIWEGFSCDRLPEILTALEIDFVRREETGDLDTPTRIDGRIVDHSDEETTNNG
jgi:hypothetical protein